MTAHHHSTVRSRICCRVSQGRYVSDIVSSCYYLCIRITVFYERRNVYVKYSTVMLNQVVSGNQILRRVVSDALKRPVFPVLWVDAVHDRHNRKVKKYSLLYMVLPIWVISYIRSLIESICYLLIIPDPDAWKRSGLTNWCGKNQRRDLWRLFAQFSCCHWGLHWSLSHFLSKFWPFKNCHSMLYWWRLSGWRK